MKRTIDFLRKSSLLVMSLSLLPGCGEKGTKKSESSAASTAVTTENEGPVLCKIDGKPVITEAELNNRIGAMLQANPYLKGATVDSLPAATKRSILDQAVSQELIIVDAMAHNIEQDAEFKKAYEDMLKLAKNSIIVQLFTKKIYDEIAVSDSEIDKDYQENKQRYVKTPGGVMVAGVKFDKDADANAFMGKVSGAQSVADFEKAAAQAQGGSLKNFGRVSKDSSRNQFQADPVPGPIKEAALTAPSMPHVEKIKVGKDVWVIQASDKRDTEYFDLAEIKPQLESMIKNKKMQTTVEEKLKDLRGAHTIEINDAYFNEKMAQEKTAPDEQEEAGHANPAAAA